MGDKRGRGEVATADMKGRIEALLKERFDVGFVIDQLWVRYFEAVTGDGHVYEFAEGSDPVRPDGERDQ